VYLFALSPGAEAIVATLRSELGDDAVEKRPRRHEVVLSADADDQRELFERLLSVLERYHPEWRMLVELEPVGRLEQSAAPGRLS
jgi:hypothetical protein